MIETLREVEFQAPIWLWGIALIPVLALVVWLLVLHRRGNVARYADPAVMGAAALRVPRRPGRTLAAVLALGALAFAFLAMSRPYVMANSEKARGTVIVAMDISNSMMNTDMPPTRLAVAQDAARRFIDEAPKDVRIGLVAFSGRARVVASPTTDRAVLNQALEEHFSTTTYGTVIGDAISAGLGSLQASGAIDELPARPQESAARMLLITDGAQVGGDVSPEQGAQMAAAQRVPVYTIMIGNDPGVRNQAPPPDTLAAISSTTGGVFAQTVTADDLRAVFADMGRVIAPEPETVEYAWAAAAAAVVVLLLAGLALVAPPRGARGRAGAARAA